MTAVDLVLSALADPTRREVLTALGGRPTTATALARDLPITRQAVLKHLVVLERSSLVRSRRSGREVRFEVRPETLNATADWMASLAAQWDERLLALKERAEAGADVAGEADPTEGPALPRRR
jgi:DNA-binding transcriptional ArsR family regulator